MHPAARRILLILLGLAGLLAALPVQSASARTWAPGGTQRTATPQAKPVRTPASVAPDRMVGVTLPGVPVDLTELDQLAGELGHKPNTVMWYVQWAGGAGFSATDADRVTAWGAVPEITWEPWDPTAGVDQPDYSLARISGGAFDAYLTSWATAIRTWGKPLRLRFGHEMNGTWYPWAEGVNGNAPGSFVAAWQHVRAVFARQSVTNVSWVWSPNIPFTGSVPLAQVFPGDTSIDEAALDGYNWSTLQPWSTWTPFADVFGEGFSELTALTAKPISVGETGCPEVGGDKAQWITDMWAALSAQPSVRGVMWFDFDKETDWRIDSSATALGAFSTGMASYLAG